MPLFLFSFRLGNGGGNVNSEYRRNFLTHLSFDVPSSSSSSTVKAQRTFPVGQRSLQCWPRRGRARTPLAQPQWFRVRDLSPPLNLRRPSGSSVEVWRDFNLRGAKGISTSVEGTGAHGCPARGVWQHLAPHSCTVKFAHAEQPDQIVTR